MTERKSEEHIRQNQSSFSWEKNFKIDFARQSFNLLFYQGTRNMVIQSTLFKLLRFHTGTNGYPETHYRDTGTPYSKPVLPRPNRDVCHP